MADAFGLKVQAEMNRKAGVYLSEKTKRILEESKRIQDEHFLDFKSYAASRISELLAVDELKGFLKRYAGLQDIKVSMKKSIYSKNLYDERLCLKFEGDELILSVGHRVDSEDRYSEFAFNTFTSGLVALGVPFKPSEKSYDRSGTLLLKNL